jgi:signal recognition particle receptor subunit beta
MVLFNYATKEITAKIVYYGPGLCGKTTNLQFVYDSLPSNNKSKMLSLATKTDRTLFFDFLPLDLGKIRGMRTKLQLYTVPGQVYYNSTRQLVLKGADGVVFVADSQDFALDANHESLQNLEDNLKRQGIRLPEIPVVLQYNKRDLPNALSVAELNGSLNKRLNVPTFESVATTGLGVEQTLKGITALVLAHLVKKYGLEGSEPLEKEINVLNPVMAPAAPAEEDSVWSDDNVLATTVTGVAPPSSNPNDAFVLDDDDSDSDIPVVRTELVEAFKPAASPFDELVFDAPDANPLPLGDPSMEVPLASVEMSLPEGLLDSLPKLGEDPLGVSGTPPARRSSDGLVREVTLPLNLTLDELKNNRKLKLKITLDINILS